MFFTLSKLLSGLLDPATLLAIFVLGGGLARALKRQRLAAVLTTASAILVLLFGILPTAKWLAVPLETRFRASSLPDHVAGVIALGGTERLEQSAVWGQPTLTDPTPIAALIALGRRYPGAILAFTGGGRSASNPAVSEAVIVREFTGEFGANSAAIIYEDQARNTLENAVLSHRLIQPKPGDRWILVCQAIGMPRAVGVFRKAGWDVIPYPAGYLTDGRSGTLAFDLKGGLDLASVATHEWVGLLAYWFMGYTDELFPHPLREPQ